MVGEAPIKMDFYFYYERQDFIVAEALVTTLNQ